MLSFESDPAMYNGRPMIPGTGLPAWIVAAMLQSGASLDEVLAAYPYLARALLEQCVPQLMQMPVCS